MQRFKHIFLIPDSLAEDDDALARALTLARNNRATLTIAWIIEETDDAEADIALRREMIEAATEALEKMAVRGRQDGLTVDTRVLVGRPFIEIIREVNAHGHDLVMKTARGRKLVSNLFFGTTGLHLMRKAPCPVWMLHPERQTLRGGILAAVNPDTTDDARLALNVKIMELATSLAALEETPVHVVHAWQVPYEDMVRYSPFLRVAKKGADAYVADIETRHRERFEALISRFRPHVPSTNVHFIKGLAEEIVPRLAHDLGIEVIVMATLARTGVPGLLIGNTAEAILSQVRCSVLAIKPEGFVSPISA